MVICDATQPAMLIRTIAEGTDVIYSSLENALLHREGDDQSETIKDEKAALA